MPSGLLGYFSDESVREASEASCGRVGAAKAISCEAVSSSVLTEAVGRRSRDGWLVQSAS